MNPNSTYSQLINTVSALLMIVILFAVLIIGFMFMTGRARCIPIEGTRKGVCTYDFDRPFGGPFREVNLTSVQK